MVLLIIFILCDGRLIKGKDQFNFWQSIELTVSVRKKFFNAAKDSLPQGLWSEFIDHPFVRGIADGTLPVESFTYYLKQDYLYLQHYARAAALAAYKCNTVVILYRSLLETKHSLFKLIPWIQLVETLL